MSSEDTQALSKEHQTPIVDRQSTSTSQTPLTATSSYFQESQERRALKYKGNERNKYLLDLKLNELKEMKEKKDDLETRLLALPCIRSTFNTRKEYKEQLEVIEGTIEAIESDLKRLDRRMQPHQKTISGNTPFAPSLASATPVPHRNI